jgi:hypothetical protein
MLVAEPEYGLSTLVYYSPVSTIPPLTDYPADAHPETEVLGVDLVPVQPHKYVLSTIDPLRQLTTLTPVSPQT